VLFVDADTEVDADWVARALAATERNPDHAGYGGRIEEWVVEPDGTEHPGVPDLNRVGDDERDIDLLTTPALYRRSMLLAVGGYDARLNAEEDFELGLRLAHAGYRLRLLKGPAGRHWNEPRPSFAELERRWSTGLAFGPGQALRLYLGRPGFDRLIERQRLPFGALLMWTVGVVALLRSLVGDLTPLFLWLMVSIACVALMIVRKRSVRLALHSLLTWTVNGAGLVVGFFSLPRGPRARPA
jgi:cellulose synthase/poly-beta-1,6-N-acetylglucosamine synthase-like glycosyltransferase